MSKSQKKKQVKKPGLIKFIFIKIGNLLTKFPLFTLIVILLFLFGLIFASNKMREPEVIVEEKSIDPRTVTTYRIGTAPTIKVSGKVEKKGVITIVAQTPGIVQKINVKEGDDILQGKSVISLASNYYGGNTFSLQRQVIQKQKEFSEDTNALEKEVIQKNRDIANKSEDNSSELREINRKSQEDSQELLTFNESLLESVENTISTSTSSAEVSAALQLKGQLMGANNQLKSAIRGLDYSTNDDNPPAQLANLQRDMVIKQLEIQEKAVDLNKEVVDLQYKIARVNEALMYPGAPFAGRVERVHVKKGQAVNPGTPLVTLHCDMLAMQVVVTVPREIAKSVNSYEASKLIIGDQIINVFPEYISTEATHGQLYSVIYAIPESYAGMVTNMGFVSVEMPVGLAQTGTTIPFIPLDSVYQNELSSTVFVIEDDVSVSREVILGTVRGSYVEVLEGIDSGDVLIVDRSVVDGEKVEAL